ncbi:hypothetical protein [Acerihabitans sp.]|uniref:hypothetical protein n=1 Tax=Acerihabitans sp. TaxID=2811394 RepID=UPI002ED96D4B
MPISYNPIASEPAFTSLTLSNADGAGGQVQDNPGMKSRIINSLQRTANTVQPLIRPICILTLSMASVGITVFTQRLIAASIRDISRPLPVSHIEESRLEHACRNIGTELGTIGGAASGLTLGGGIALYKKNMAPHLAVGLSVIGCTAIGAISGMIYSFYVENLPEAVDN